MRIGFASFGGPAAQIALMHRVAVEEKRWLDEPRFLHALNFCMLLPGPEAQQLATYIGWLLHGIRGGLVAGLLFILPGAVVIAALAAVYALYGRLPAVEAAFLGVKAAVLALVVEALLRIAGRALRDGFAWALACGAFAALFLFDAPFPAVIAAAALMGGARALFGGGGAGEADAPAALDASAGGRSGTGRLALILLAAWLLPTALLLAWLGGGHVFSGIAVFFSKMAVLTFGGAYAVLSWVAQEAVAARGWLAPGEMLDALGLAETTPGPLILVVEFVGFLAAWREAGGLDPLVAGLLGAALTLWVTFAPGFLFIFAGAPHVERLRGRPGLQAALAGVTAAVVGVIANLSAWFALNLLFAEGARTGAGPVSVYLPNPASLDLKALALAALAAVALFLLKLAAFRTLALAALAGLALFVAGL